MEHYVGLDVSLKLTAICIVDRGGKIERQGVVSSDPEAIATFIKSLDLWRADSLSPSMAQARNYPMCKNAAAPKRSRINVRLDHS